MISHSTGAVLARRRALWVAATAAAVLVPLLAGCSATTTVAASCAAPTVEVSTPRVHAGDSVTLTGEYFFKECLDTGQGARPNGATNIALTLAPSNDPSASLDLLAVDADDDGRLSTEVTIPADAPIGEAQLRVGEDTSVAVEIVAD